MRAETAMPSELQQVATDLKRRVLSVYEGAVTLSGRGEAVGEAAALAAALREGHRLPLCMQGDRCQVDAKKYAAEAEGEVGEVKKLIGEEIGAGFFNIDVDTSTLVDLEQPGLDRQQRLNYERAAEIT